LRSDSPICLFSARSCLDVFLVRVDRGKFLSFVGGAERAGRRPLMLAYTNRQRHRERAWVLSAFSEPARAAGLSKADPLCDAGCGRLLSVQKIRIWRL